MTTKEIKDALLNHGDDSWYENRKVTLNFPSEEYSVTFESFLSLYKFIQNEVNISEKYEVSNSQPVVAIINSFKLVLNQFDVLLGVLKTNPSSSNLGSHWNNRISRPLSALNSNSILLPSRSKFDFLEKVHSNFPNSVDSAYKFLTNQSANNNNRHSIIGTNLAYEFIVDEHSDIVGRKKVERKKILEHINTLDDSKNKILDTVMAHLKDVDSKVSDFKSTLETERVAKEAQLKGIISKAETNFGSSQASIANKFDELVNTYDELLRLKKPADYWRKRSIELKEEAWRTVYIMIAVTVLIAGSLYFLLWLTPDGMLLSFKDSNSAAIKWSIIYITFLSSLVFLVRGLYKLAFSAFHLARDAEEREQLMYVYLSMIKDSSIDIEDRQLVMQSLFSRADTGLLKDDSGPTMPSGIISKVISGK